MRTIQLTLSDNVGKDLERLAQEAGHEDPGAYVESLVLADCRRTNRERLEAEIRKGLDCPSRELSDADWERLLGEYERRVRTERASDVSG